MPHLKNRSNTGHRAVLQYRRPQLQERMIYSEHDEWFYEKTNHQFPGKFNAFNNKSTRPSIIREKFDFYSWKILPITKCEGYIGNKNRYYIPAGTKTDIGYIFTVQSYIVEQFPVMLRYNDIYFTSVKYEGLISSKDIIDSISEG